MGLEKRRSKGDRSPSFPEAHAQHAAMHEYSRRAALSAHRAANERADPANGETMHGRKQAKCRRMSSEKLRELPRPGIDHGDAKKRSGRPLRRAPPSRRRRECWRSEPPSHRRDDPARRPKLRPAARDIRAACQPSCSPTASMVKPRFCAPAQRRNGAKEMHVRVGDGEGAPGRPACCIAPIELERSWPPPGSWVSPVDSASCVRPATLFTPSFFIMVLR